MSLDIREQKGVTGSEGAPPYLYVEWDERRVPHIVVGGFHLRVERPDLIERLAYITNMLRSGQ